MKFKLFLYRLKNKIRKYPSRYRISNLITKLHPKTTDLNLVRLGGDSDGGYLVANDLVGIEACFSAGVGDVSDFEYHCAEKGMKIFMADASVEAPAIKDHRFNFQKKFIGCDNFEEYITLDEWVKNSEIKSDSDLLLQMDIEGSELDVLQSCSSEILKRFRIIVVEFHELHRLSNADFFKKVNLAFKKLLENHFCVHIHPNNCCGIRKVDGIEVPVVGEFSFIRKDRVKILGEAKKFPHELDKDNVQKPSIALPEIWYNNA